MSLLVKEIKGVVFSIIYLVFVGAMVLFYATQFGGSVQRGIEKAAQGGHEAQDSPFAKPQPGAESYGSIAAEMPQQVMPNIISTLLREYEENRYVTHPMGFYKRISLSEGQQEQVLAMIERICGMPLQAVAEHYNAWLVANVLEMEGGYWMQDPDAAVEGSIPIAVDYETFKDEMAWLDTLLGGSSSYAPEGFAMAGRVQMSYEQALEQYNSFLEKDRITGAYARLFCDYMGIAIALFAAFVPVGFLMRDRRANAQQLIFSRKVSSARLVLVRYAACLLAVLLPVVLLCIAPTVQIVLYAAQNGLQADTLGFLKYIGGWLLPTAMVACSVGFFFTILTGTPIGVLVQFVWSFFVDISGSVRSMQGGGYKGTLVLRHNQVGGRHLMENNWDALVRNRVGYTLLALALLVASVVLYELQRRGVLDVRAAIAKRFGRGKKAIQADAAA